MYCWALNSRTARPSRLLFYIIVKAQGGEVVIERQNVKVEWETVKQHIFIFQLDLDRLITFYRTKSDGAASQKWIRNIYRMFVVFFLHDYKAFLNILLTELINRSIYSNVLRVLFTKKYILNLSEKNLQSKEYNKRTTLLIKTCTNVLLQKTKVSIVRDPIYLV